VSIPLRSDVSTLIRQRIGTTVQLVAFASLIIVVVGIGLGVLGGLRRGIVDNVVIVLSTLSAAVPSFVASIILLSVFAVNLGWFPVGGLEDPGSTATGFAQLLDQFHHMLLPGITLAIAFFGEYMIVARSSMIETLREDYLQLARAKGMRDDDVRRQHAVPNARLPVVSLSAINFGFIVSGAIAVESIFSWPGIGQATLLAIRGPDLPVLQGLFLLISAAVIVANLLADLLYGALDPRVVGR
jgi:peptide/nickel transport system permease protein